VDVTPIEQYEKLVEVAGTDNAVMDQLERFVDACQNHYANVVLSKDESDSQGEVMSCLYTLNRQIMSRYVDEFPSGLFAGTPDEVYEWAGLLLNELFYRRGA
jgi:hypothetical protein